MKKPQISILNGMNAISIDQLDESKKFFITLEPSKSPEQFEEFLGVNTIAVDSVINSMPGMINDDLVRGLNINKGEIDRGEILFEGEPGFFQIASEDIYLSSLSTENKLEIIFNEIKKYFSKKRRMKCLDRSTKNQHIKKTLIEFTLILKRR